jgi:hypothetical protein
MALISKKTFREWAKVLTDRGLTFDNVDLVTESGNGITIKQKREGLTFGPITVREIAGTISFRLGAVWFNGGLIPWKGYSIGNIVTIPFAPFDSNQLRREQTVYARLDYRHHAEYNQFEIFAPPAILNFWTVTRAHQLADDINDGVQFEVGFTQPIPAQGEIVYDSTPAYINTLTNAGTIGTARQAVATISYVEPDPPTIPFGYWKATTIPGSDPSKMIIFNLETSASRTWPLDQTSISVV